MAKEEEKKEDSVYDEEGREKLVSEDSNIGILVGTEIDETKLQQLLGEDYETIKEKMRVENDFCIFLEDENGDIIYISPGQPGIGSDKINISDIPCD